MRWVARVCSTVRQPSWLSSCRQLSSPVASSSQDSAVSTSGIDHTWRGPAAQFVETPQAWLETLSDEGSQRIGLLDLHPDVWRVTPRLDILHRNINWQQVYRNIQLTKMLTRAEMPGGGRKPWPQKRMGRHHAGSVRAPGFVHGGFAHGARGPRTWFYMLPDPVRVEGLCVALTVKHVQNDIHIVDSLKSLPLSNVPADVASKIYSMADERNWGYSVLFVTESDEIDEKLADALDTMPGHTVMPYYGLNCFSLMKYDTVILEKAAADRITKQLLLFKQRAGSLNSKFCYMDWKDKLLTEARAEGKEDPKWPPMPEYVTICCNGCDRRQLDIGGLLRV